MTKVKALKAFAARVNGRGFSASQGQVIDMPNGVNWIKEGLVEMIGPAQAPAKKRTRKTSAKAAQRETR